ncbi:hypothetical protein [Paraflavitalea pollutisoli]|uniref:hypothetical protein n=1 Tax=Paraflavitalea pollutisoli TaxID=3034143 RepID=UPI0023EB6174|nr:hypothetical protein [Paraflavitalea sp. H1-2-19X]
MKYKIGFIDEDADQVDTYERRLRKKDFEVIGYKIEKGVTLDNLLSQVYNSNIDLLMVDFLLSDRGILDFNGDEVVREYQKIKPGFPTIVFTNLEGQAFPKVDNPNIVYEKEMTLKENIDRFTEILRKNILVYQRYIQERKDLIAVLSEKAATKGLDAKDKHSLSVAQFELQNLDKRAAPEAPMQLLNIDKIETLTETTKEAEAFLEELIKNQKKNDPKR